MEFRSAVLGSHSESHWNYGKNEHENSLEKKYLNLDY